MAKNPRDQSGEKHVMKVIIKGGSNDTNTYYYDMDLQHSNAFSSEAVLSDLNKLVQLQSYESRRNNLEIKKLQEEVKEIRRVLDKVLSQCEDETKTSEETLE